MSWSRALPTAILLLLPAVGNAQLTGSFNATPPAGIPGLGATGFGAGVAIPAVPPVPNVFDYLGVPRIASKVHKTIGEIGQIPLVQFAVGGVIDPVLTTVGLKAGPGQSLLSPSLGGQPFGPPGAGPPPFPAGPGAAAGPSAPAGAGTGGPATGGAAPAGAAVAGGDDGGGAVEAPPPDPSALAASLSAKESDAEQAAKVAAIRYLGKQNCVCYPETIDALLGVLGDCDELIRYESLRALRGGCQSSGSCQVCKSSPSGNNPHHTCICNDRVMKKLSDLLLEKDPAGRFKERSYRVRQLAKLILSSCLQSTPVQPDALLVPQPDPIIPTRFRR